MRRSTFGQHLIVHSFNFPIKLIRIHFLIPYFKNWNLLRFALTSLMLCIKKIQETIETLCTDHIEIIFFPRMIPDEMKCAVRKHRFRNQADKVNS